MQRKHGDFPDERLVKKADVSVRRGIDAFQRIKQCRACHVEVARALVASAVLRQHGKVAVEHAQSAGYALASAPTVPLQKKQHVDDIGENPRCPVAYILPDHAHPPEIIVRHKRRYDPTINLLPHAPRNQRADSVELILQQVQNIRQRRRCLRGKEIDIGVCRVRQRTLVHRRSAGVIASVVCAQHPCRFLADAPKPVDDCIQICSVVQQTFAQHRAHQQAAPREIWLFISHSVARSAERKKLRRRHHRVARSGFVCPRKDLLFFALGDGVPRCPLLPLGKRMIIFRNPQMLMKRVRIQISSKHISPSCRSWQCLQ